MAYNSIYYFRMDKKIITVSIQVPNKFFEGNLGTRSGGQNSTKQHDDLNFYYILILFLSQLKLTYTRIQGGQDTESYARETIYRDKILNIEGKKQIKKYMHIHLLGSRNNHTI